MKFKERKNTHPSKDCCESVFPPKLNFKNYETKMGRNKSTNSKQDNIEGNFKQILKNNL